MKNIYLVSIITIIIALIFTIKPDWFKFMWGLQILLLPLVSGMFMSLVQNENRSYKFLPKLIAGSFLTSFIFTFLWRFIGYSFGEQVYVLETLYTSLLLSAFCVFGGLIGIVIRGFTLLCKKQK